MYPTRYPADDDSREGSQSSPKEHPHGPRSRSRLRISRYDHRPRSPRHAFWQGGERFPLSQPRLTPKTVAASPDHASSWCASPVWLSTSAPFVSTGTSDKSPTPPPRMHTGAPSAPGEAHMQHHRPRVEPYVRSTPKYPDEAKGAPIRSALLPSILPATP